MQAQVSARLSVAWARARRTGLLRTAWTRLLSATTAVALSPLTLLLHLLGFRRLTIVTSRIGHLAIEPDSFLKARALGELPHRRWLFIAPREWVANGHLLSYWAPHLPAVQNPVVSRLLAAMTSFGLMSYDTGRYVMWYGHNQDFYRLNAAWANRPPLLGLSDEDAVWGDSMLLQLGLPPGAWFVCVHAREEGFSPDDDAVQRYRNSDAGALIPAMREIVARGGWCVRMGHPSGRPLPAIDGVVDYAHHPSRGERLDVVLCAKARFFLGNSSGLAMVSSVFGRPCIRVNVVPMSGFGPMPNDLSIPKLYVDRKADRLLRFDEILGTPGASYRIAAQYERAGIDLRENSADEILDATVEMLDRLEGRAVADPEGDELHRRFMSLLRPTDYGYGAPSRVGVAFLRKYRHLLPE